jgi:hypothetical protein
MKRLQLSFLAVLVLGLAIGSAAHATSIGWSTDVASSGDVEAFYSYGSYSTSYSSTCGGWFGTTCTVYSSYNDYDRYGGTSYSSYDTNYFDGGYCRDDYQPPSNQVPEPSAALVFGFGALLIGRRSRRR